MYKTQIDQTRKAWVDLAKNPSAKTTMEATCSRPWMRRRPRSRRMAVRSDRRAPLKRSGADQAPFLGGGPGGRERPTKPARRSSGTRRKRRVHRRRAI